MSFQLAIGHARMIPQKIAETIFSSIASAQADLLDNVCCLKLSYG
jgi:hypothetical protein